MIVNAKCLYCDATITGERNYMLRGVGLNMDGRRKPKWLKEQPEFKWTWNGVNNKEFYLCPEHIDQLQEAFKWCMREDD